MFIMLVNLLTINSICFLLLKTCTLLISIQLPTLNINFSVIRSFILYPPKKGQNMLTPTLPFKLKMLGKYVVALTVSYPHSAILTCLAGCLSSSYFIVLILPYFLFYWYDT